MAETKTLLELVIRMVELLEKIEENTRPETIEESKNKITGFSAEDTRNSPF